MTVSSDPRRVAPVELVADRVLLRPYRGEDADVVFDAAFESVDTVGRWMPWCHAGYARADSADWVEKARSTWETGDGYEFGAFDRDGDYLGGAGLNQFNRVNNFANLGYWVRQSRQGCGLAPAFVALLARFGFSAVGLTRIEIVVATENARSRRVAEKAGARFEGIARNRIVIGGIATAAAIYALVPDDFA